MTFNLMSMNQQQPSQAFSSSSISTATATTTPLPIAATEKIIQILNNDFVTLSNDYTHSDSLTTAVNNNNITTVTTLFSKFSEATYPLLYLYIQHAQLDRLDKLIILMSNNNQHFDINYAPINYPSLLDYACQCLLNDKKNTQRVEIIRRFLAYGASIAQYVMKNDLKNVGILLAHGAYLNGPANQWLLPYTVNQGMLDMAALLLKHKAPAHHCDAYGRTLINAPLNNGNYNMVQLLLKHNIAPFVPQSPQSALIRAVEKNKTNTLLQWLRFHNAAAEQLLIQATKDHEEAIEATQNHQDETRAKIDQDYNQILQNIKANMLNGNAINEKGEHLLTIAARKSKRALWLLVHFGKAHLRYCVKQGDTATVQRVLKYMSHHFTLQELQILLTKAHEYHHDDIVQLLETHIKTMQEHDEKGKAPQEPADLITESENKFRIAMEHYTEGFQQQPALPHHTYTQPELDFWAALHYKSFAIALTTLQKNPTIRLGMFNRPEPGYNVLTYILGICINPQANTTIIDTSKTLLKYLLEKHFNAIYPFILQLVCNNKNLEALEALIRLGLKVNQLPHNNNNEASTFFQPINTCSLINAALMTAKPNPADYKKIRLLLQADASLIPMLEEQDYEIDTGMISFLKATLRPISHHQKNIFLQAIRQQASNATPNAWDLGAALYRALTGQQPPTIPVKTSLPEPILAVSTTNHVTNFDTEPSSPSKGISKKITEVISFYKQAITTYMQHYNAYHAQSTSSTSSSSTITPRLLLRPSLAEASKQPPLHPLHRDDSQRSDNLAALLSKHASQ